MNDKAAMIDYPVTARRNGEWITLCGVGPLYGGPSEFAYVRVVEQGKEYPEIELSPAGVQWLQLGGTVQRLLDAVREFREESS